MSAIVLMFLINISFLVNGQKTIIQSSKHNATNTIHKNECITDLRVSMLRCVSVSFNLVKEALDHWDLNSITRLQIYQGKFKNFDKLIHSMSFDSTSCLKWSTEALGNAHPSCLIRPSDL